MSKEGNAQIILTAVDDNPHYMEGVRVFLYSLWKNSPEQKIVVCAMNWKDCSVIKKINPNATVVAEKTDEKNPHVRNYRRHSLILEWFARGYDKIAWLDNDIIVRHNIGRIFSRVKANTIKVWTKMKRKDHGKFQGGVYVLGNGETTKRYLRGIIRGLAGRGGWLLPQLLMYRLFLKYKLNFVKLSHRYNDSFFRKDSLIWHCKQSHFKEKRYQKEYKRYLDEANKNIA
jgi:hypothetical protein